MEMVVFFKAWMSLAVIKRNILMIRGSVFKLGYDRKKSILRVRIWSRLVSHLGGIGGRRYNTRELEEDVIKT